MSKSRKPKPSKPGSKGSQVRKSAPHAGPMPEGQKRVTGARMGRSMTKTGCQDGTNH